MKPGLRLALTRALALLIVVAISVFVFINRDKAEELAAYGYIGIFVLSFLAYATVFLPAPGVAVVFTFGAVLNPWIIALVAGSGAALGEFIGYLAGYSGQGIAGRAKIYDKLEGWMRKNGILTVFVLSAIPNPIFDLAGLIAGILKMPFVKFFVACWLGETLKMLVFSLAGAAVMEWFF
jgi:membrane protein YqaA with SNARE-associated domain